MFDVVRDELAGLARTDPRTLADTELLDAARDIGRVRRMLDAVEAHVLSELDVRGTTEIVSGMRTGAWLGRETGLPAGAATGRVKLANRLRTVLPDVDDALAAGRIGWDHARVLSRAANPRIVDLIVELSPELINAAQHMGFDPWQRMVEGIVTRLDQDGGYRPGDDPANSRLHVRPVGDSTALNGNFTGEWALSVRQLLDAEADRVWREHRDLSTATNGEHEVPCRAALVAEALVRLCTKGSATDLASTAPPAPELVIVLNENQLEQPTTLDGRPVSSVVLCLLAAAVVMRPVVIDRDGDPLWAGDVARLANRQQRRALAIRDGGCVFPGCNRPHSWTDAHHVIPWDPKHGNGPSDIDNFASLCGFHHGVTHRKGWIMATADDQWFTWTTPAGTVLHSQRHGQQRAGPTTAAA